MNFEILMLVKDKPITDGFILIKNGDSISKMSTTRYTKLYSKQKLKSIPSLETSRQQHSLIYSDALNGLKYIGSMEGVYEYLTKDPRIKLQPEL
jgi:hypothetical protein